MQSDRRRHRGITVFELVVVMMVAILLAALCFVSTRTVVLRTKFSRVKEEHRMLAHALSKYQLDYSALPSSAQGLDVLASSQNAQWGRLPRDPFRTNDGGYVYIYTGNPDTGYLLISPGPDGDYDLPAELLALLPAARAEQVAPLSQETPIVVGGSTSVPEGTALVDLIREYVTHGQYDPARKKTEDGDIVTLVRH